MQSAVTVGIIDSGLNLSSVIHPKAVMGFSVCVIDDDVHLFENTFDDENTHGTMCYKTIMGVNPHCNYVIVMTHESWTASRLLIHVVYGTPLEPSGSSERIAC